MTPTMQFSVTIVMLCIAAVDSALIVFPHQAQVYENRPENLAFSSLSSRQALHKDSLSDDQTHGREAISASRKLLFKDMQLDSDSEDNAENDPTGLETTEETFTSEETTEPDTTEPATEELFTDTDHSTSPTDGQQTTAGQPVKLGHTTPPKTFLPSEENSEPQSSEETDEQATSEEPMTTWEPETSAATGP